MRIGDTGKTKEQLRAELAALRIKAERLEEAERFMRESGERYRRLLESVTDYVYTVRVENGQAVGTTHGEGCERLTGFAPEEYSDDPNLWIEMVHPDDRHLVREWAERLSRGLPSPPLAHRIIRKDGGVRWVRNTAVLHRDALGRIAFYDGVVQDITDAKEHEEDIRRSSLSDALTGLPNRVVLMARLDRVLADARLCNSKVAVLFLDLDRFKPVNDHFGHAVGDAVLKEVAQRLVSQVRTTDLVARVGGDEFVVVLADQRGESGPAEVARKLTASLRKPYASLGGVRGPGASVGVSLYPDDALEPEELLRKADEAMYAAKHHRRGSVAFHARLEGKRPGRHA
ncbi:hypothetical protein JCM15519_19540 [Fundidesulfovibrio butyratiphilus]